MPGFTLPKDNNSDALQALGISTSTNSSVSSGAAVRSALPSDTQIVRIASLTNCYIKFGDSTVVATTSDMLFPIGAEVFSIKDRGYTHCSVRGASVTPDICSITRMV